MSERFSTVHPIDQTPSVLRHLSRLSGFIPDDARRVGSVRVYAKFSAATPGVALRRLEPAIEV